MKRNMFSCPIFLDRFIDRKSKEMGISKSAYVRHVLINEMHNTQKKQDL